MDEKEIITSIQILNELCRSEFLQIEKIDINIGVINDIIKKKKSKKIVDIFNNLSSNEQNSTESHISAKESPKVSPKEISNSSIDESTQPIEDSIAVTNFTIPSSVYNKTATSTNGNSVSNSTANN